ncbi:MAG: diguanylate cyclase [Rubrivivax sp.]
MSFAESARLGQAAPAGALTTTLTHLRRCFFALLVSTVVGLPTTRASSVGVGDAGVPQPPPAAFSQLERLTEDDPRAALSKAREALSRPSDPTTRFWLQLGLARIQGVLEDPAAQRTALDDATATLKALPRPEPQMALWLELEQISALLAQVDPAEVQVRLAEFRRKVAQFGEPMLRCETLSTELWALSASASHDEAWLTAEEVERCGELPGLQAMRSWGLQAMGRLAVESRKGQPDAELALSLFARAEGALSDAPARFRRSLLAWDFGNALRELKRPQEALAQLEKGLGLSRSLGDEAGVAAAYLSIGRLHVDSGQPDRALPFLDDALALYRRWGEAHRTTTTLGVKIRAQAALKRPEVLATIEQARAFDFDHDQPLSRAVLARAMAEGYASQQQWQRAYAELKRAQDFEDKGRRLARDDQVLRLQARYDTARREAENAELRHRSETARLALEAETARQRALWLAIAVLGLAASAGIGVAWRALRRRRNLLDLALKDALTGTGNRRAVTAYAVQQLEQAQRMGLPLSVALIDLDHFKAVNDTYGHATGDEVLKAFARAAGDVLRGQDRLGRWGGEEWLLVMPGTSPEELTAVFRRLRERFSAATIPGLPTPHGVTFSMGVAARTGTMNELPDLLALADRRLYEAKAGGRDGVR